MYDFHLNADEYFDTQRNNCARSVIPFIEKTNPVTKGGRVLEIGCGTAGVLTAFLERGCSGAGIDITKPTIDYAKKRLSDCQNLILIEKDIYKASAEEDFGGLFDIIVLKDVIEHIPNQERLLAHIKTFLAPNGVVFFGFPPWQMPFGGHQQMLHSKLLSHTPYLHLLPRSVYSFLIKLVGENPQSFLDLKDTGISIERFERIAKQSGYRIVNKEFHFINPIYEYKFGMKMRRQSKIIAAIPYLRDFLTTSVFYLLT